MYYRLLNAVSFYVHLSGFISSNNPVTLPPGTIFKLTGKPNRLIGTMMLGTKLLYVVKVEIRTTSEVLDQYKQMENMKVTGTGPATLTGSITIDDLFLGFEPVAIPDTEQF